MINQKLVEYIESKIITQYKDYDGAHQPDHVYQVIENSKVNKRLLTCNARVPSSNLGSGSKRSLVLEFTLIIGFFYCIGGKYE